MVGSRTEILGKIRRALATPRLPHHHGHSEVADDIRALFASVSSRDDLVAKFRREFEAVSGEFFAAASEAEVIAILKRLILDSLVERAAVSLHSICVQLRVAGQLKAEIPGVEWVEENIDSEDSFQRASLKQALSQVKLSITGCEYLLAESGTIVNAAGPQATRQLSLLPSIHVVLATSAQIYPNMADLFLDVQKQNGTHLPGSALTCITGPSRTADIEKVLIKGVHGPTRIVVVMVDQKGL